MEVCHLDLLGFLDEEFAGYFNLDKVTAPVRLEYYGWGGFSGVGKRFLVFRSSNSP